MRCASVCTRQNPPAQEPRTLTMRGRKVWIKVQATLTLHNNKPLLQTEAVVANTEPDITN